MSIRIIVEFGHLYYCRSNAYLGIEEPYRQKVRNLLWGDDSLDEFQNIYVDSAQQEKIESIINASSFKNLYYDLEGFIRVLRLCNSNVDMTINLFEELKCKPEKKFNEQESQLTKS